MTGGRVTDDGVAPLAENDVSAIKAEALREAAEQLLTISPNNPNTGADTLVAAWLRGRAARDVRAYRDTLKQSTERSS